MSSSQYISSYEIAASTQINRRLVRDEMANIRTILKSLGYELVSKTSKGYRINDLSSESLNRLSHFIDEAERQRESIFPTLPGERESFIIRRLIEKDDYIKIDDLASELLISRSTISASLKHSKATLDKYDLSIKQRPNYGICLIGNELNKRKPLCDYYFTNLQSSHMFYDYFMLLY